MSEEAPKRKRARQCPELDQHRQEITDIYYTKNWSIKQIKEHFNKEYGLNATENQYKGRLYDSWGCRKRIKRSEWVKIDQQVSAREADGKAESSVSLRSSVYISHEMIERGVRRHVTFTDRMFQQASNNTKTNNDVLNMDSQIIVSTPPNFDLWSSSFPEPHIKIPSFIFQRLPIIVSLKQKSFVTLLQRLMPSESSSQISSSNGHPALVFIKVILFRLSNNMADREEIDRLLDSVDRLNYRYVLKGLLSLNTVSIEAAAYSIIPILYARADYEMVTQIHCVYPSTKQPLYEMLRDEVNNILHYHPPFIRRHTLNFLRFNMFGSSFLQQNYMDQSNTLNMLLHYIPLYKIPPPSVGMAQILLFALADFKGNIESFFRVWDRELVPLSLLDQIEVRDYNSQVRTIFVYCPFLNTGFEITKHLLEEGFNYGHSLVLLKAFIDHDDMMIELLVKKFYPEWAPSNNDSSYLSFDVDEEGLFIDRKLSSLLWDASKILLDIHKIGWEHHKDYINKWSFLWSVSDPWLSRNTPQATDPIGKSPLTICYAYLLFHISIFKPEYMDIIFRHLERTYPTDLFQGLLADLLWLIEDELYETTHHFANGTIFRLRIVIPFLGDSTFIGVMQLLETIRKHGDIDRYSSFVRRVKYLLCFQLPELGHREEESQLYSIQLYKAFESFRDTTQNTDDWLEPEESVYHLRRDVVRGFVSKDKILKLRSPRLNHTRPLSFLHAAFWNADPRSFSLLLHSGAKLPASCKEFEVYDGPDWTEVEAEDWKINPVFWGAVERRDLDLVSCYWEERILILKDWQAELRSPFIPTHVVDTWIDWESKESVQLILNEYASHRCYSQCDDYKFYGRQRFSLTESCFFRLLLSTYFVSGLKYPNLERNTEEHTIPLPILASRISKILAAIKSLKDCRVEQRTSEDPLSTYEEDCNHFLKDVIGRLIFHAIRNSSNDLDGSIALLEILLSDGNPDKSAAVSYFSNQIEGFIKYNHKILKLFIDAGLSLKQVYESGRWPLHYAIDHLNFNAIVCLLSEGVDILLSRNFSVYFRDVSALELAVLRNQIDTVSLLIEVRPECVEHALAAAAEFNRTFIEKSIRQWIAEKQVTPNTPNTDGLDGSTAHRISEIQRFEDITGL